MKTLQLTVSTKNINLHCVSALETIQHVMKLDNVIYLNRLVVWTISFHSSNPIEELERIMNNSFYFLNPNKECGIIGAPQKKHPNTYFVKVDREFENHFEGDIQRLNAQFGTSIAAISKSLVWEIGLQEDRRDDIVKIAESTSATTGLLSNPLYEETTILTAL